MASACRARELVLAGAALPVRELTEPLIRRVDILRRCAGDRKKRDKVEDDTVARDCYGFGTTVDGILSLNELRSRTWSLAIENRETCRRMRLAEVNAAERSMFGSISFSLEDLK